MPGGDLSSTIGLFLIMALVLVAAYYTTRFLSMKTRHLGKGANLQMVDQLYLARDKHILLLKVGDKGYLLGVTNQNVSLIGTLQKEEMLLLEENKPAKESWMKGANAVSPKIGEFISKMIAAPEILRTMRKETGQKNGQKIQVQPQEDDLEVLISAVKHKRDHFGSGYKKNGDYQL